MRIPLIAACAPEIVVINDSGTIFVYNSENSDAPDDYIFEDYFPISGDFSYTSSPHIIDLDNDGDIVLFAGSSLGLEIFDIKDEGSSNEGFWNTHRANQSRTGYIELLGFSSCVTADLNKDGIIDVLDIVQTINIAMGTINPTSNQECAADINDDGVIDILDIVLMINIIINNG